MEAGFSAGIAASVGVRVQASPEWALMDVSYKIGVSASAEIGFTGYWCSFGSLEVEAYLGGTGKIDFQKEKLSYDLSGRLNLFGVFKPKVYLSGETSY